jgi:hypothetical protein
MTPPAPNKPHLSLKPDNLSVIEDEKIGDFFFPSFLFVQLLPRLEIE